ncbi:carbamoyltransferase HypF [Selenomonas sp. oral taxon 478]|uniref:carbamoyltransferase HypF n=1 Tax=Selenomonas sp. oral taxon 478 TaxID=712538 RepID=UPI000679FEF0|nr:carbamoyltransferase HypF [Selenomonas sp. oral taxon 478]AKT54903.1 HAD family hydrolase [Selenomonas sp. oral taxon 478]
MADAAHSAVHTEGGAAERRAFRVSGIVQGVGYRPFVYRLAEAYALGGWVLNDSAGVGIEAEGTAAALDAFAAALRDDAPRAALVTAVTWQAITPCGERTFRILPSPAGTRAATLVSPDLGVCADCRREILSAGDRRYGYAFTNCTNCGPRYSIIRGVPYDRPLTSMAVFPMCPACQREYDDPRDRRFHAQPNACAVCGPAYRLLVNGGVQAGDPLAAARRVVAEGGILAVKGIGGYHLACDARSEAAVARLRRRKHREAKALAVMAGSCAAVRALCLLSAEEERLLTSPAAPIVLLARRVDAVRPAAESVAPGNPYLGVMLPYAPVHLLLLGADDLWVMTSANLSGEPILYRDAAAEEGLAGIADAILVHNREIVHRVDDSVVRIGAGGPQILRRSRGYAPAPLALPFADGQSVLTGGAELKNTFCLTRSGEAFLSEHIGDLTNAAVLASYAETMAQYEQFFEVTPEVLAVDLHPAYLSGRHLAARAARDGLPLVRVQHHHAHIAAVLAEHGCHARVLGVALDGTGWGDDGTAWGGEFLAADLAGYERLAHFAPMPLPGGDRAAEEPWRLALCVLYRRDGAGFAAQFPQFAAQLPTGWELLMQATAAGLSAPLTSSAGRLFDAAAALLGVAYRSAYEGQAPIELERLARTARRAGRVLPYTVAEGARLTVDVLPALYALADGAEALTVEERAGRALDFHVTMAAAVAEVLGTLSVRTGLRTVALAGGVFQNALLLEELLPRIGGYHVLLPHRVPPNDGGIAYGQAAVALAQMRCS